MRTAKELADGFLAAAQQNPDGRNAIYRRAAQVFADLALDPRNRKQAKQLQNMAFDFVSAARTERPATIDDFENLLRERAQAYEQVGDDPMDQIARAREIHDEQRGEGERPVPSVSIAPLSFNRDATLGRSQTLRWAPSPDEIRQGVKESETVAFWQGFKREAQAITVDVALLSSPPPAQFIDAVPNLTVAMTATDTVAVVNSTTGFPFVGTIRIDDELMDYTGITPTSFTGLIRGVMGTVAAPHAIGANVVFPTIDVRPYGIVEFGSDGNHTSVRFDVGAGKRFTVVGNYCSVLVGVEKPTPGNASANISIGASIGTFGAPSPSPTVLTKYVDGLANSISLNNSTFIQIPLKAVQLLPIQSNMIYGDVLTITFFPFGGGTAITQVVYTCSATDPVPPTIPLVGDVSYIKIRYTASGGPPPGTTFRNFRLPFQLSL